MLKIFKYEDYLYHPECEEKGKLSEGDIVVTGKIKFELEGNSLRKPKVLEIDKDTKIKIKCNVCGIEEEITDKAKIEVDGYHIFLNCDFEEE